MDTGSVVARFAFAAAHSASGILRALVRAGYVAAPPTGARYECLFVDTQDGRLSGNGCRLSLRRAARRVAWHFAGPDGEGEEPFAGDAWSRSFPSDTNGIPSAASAIAAGRLLFPLVRLKVFMREALLQGPSASRFSLRAERMVAAPPWETWPKGRWPLGLLSIRLLEGDPPALLHLATYLRDRLGLSPAPGDLCRTALQALGLPEPGAPIPTHLRLRPEDPLALAGRKVAGQQILKMRASVRGTLEDLDPEYLHDLRVATRRLRSALRLFAGALGQARCESLRAELGWLARVLGAVRDLDVFGLNLREQARRLGEAGTVADVLMEELGRRRTLDRATLEAALTSRRFDVLIRRLEALAASAPPRSPRGPAAVRVVEAAPAIIRKAQKRVLALGRAIGPESPGANLHRLRILFKRLRYACEFFREAFADPASGTDPLAEYIEAMVRFQDCLGEHQDAVVAIDRILAMAKDIVRRETLPSERLLDLGGLIQVQREIAGERRARLLKLWRRFDKAAVRRHLAALETRPQQRQPLGAGTPADAVGTLGSA